jgi:tetratricopeptide (TPR) repeat protein
VLYWYNQADVLQNMNRYQDAMPLLERALEVDPAHPGSWAKMGQVHRLTQNYEKAVEAYEKALELDPEYAWAHNGEDWHSRRWGACRRTTSFRGQPNAKERSIIGTP